MVHIADLTSVVPAGSLLDDVARLRLQTIYSGALHVERAHGGRARTRRSSAHTAVELVTSLDLLSASLLAELLRTFPLPTLPLPALLPRTLMPRSLMPRLLLPRWLMPRV